MATPPGRIRALALLVVLLTGAAVAPVVGTECLARLANEGGGHEVYPLFYAPELRPMPLPALQRTWGEVFVISHLDPHLSHTHNPAAHELLGAYPGFVRYGETADDNCLRIVALGGSTTDPLTPYMLGDPSEKNDGPYNWPRSLQRKLAASGYCVEVFNGGVSGYSSNQDLIKLIRDGLSLEPDIVIMLQGVNDMGFLHSVDGHPMVHPYQKRVFEQLTNNRPGPVLPNFQAWVARKRHHSDSRAVEGVGFGLSQALHPHEQWFRNAQLSRAVTDSQGVKLLIALQPILGHGEYPMSAEEEQWLRAKGAAYHEQLREFYEQAQGLLAAQDHLIDLSDAFAEVPGAYFNARHQNEAGVDQLAERIGDEILNRGWLRAP